MSMDKKVPEIRFNDFGEEWNGRCLGSLCLIGDIDHRMPESKTTGIPYLMTGDFCGINGLDFKNAKLISIEDYELLSKKIKPEYGDILFARYASVGSVRYVETKIDFLISYSCAIIKTNNTSYGKFLFYCFQTDNTQKKIELDINTGSQRNIGIDSLKNLFVFLPKSEEQIVIGNYFQKLDSLIIQHQQKHDKLSNIKKSMLDKMFPKQGKTIPEIRFKGFSGEWEEKPFGDCFVNVPNNTLSRANLNYKTGLAKNIHYGDVLIKLGEILDASNEILPFITNDDVANKLKHATLRDGDVIIADAAEDSTVGKCTELFNINEQLVLSGLHTIAVRPTLPFASKYLGYYLNSSSYHDQLLSLMQGTKVLSISKTAIQNTNVAFPKSSEEQAAIGNYFQKLDMLINQHQQQITKLNNIKQACLSKMFV